MERYNIINNKNKREIVLLRGSGCIYKKCRFCDYYKDSSINELENIALNSSVLSMVTGKYNDLEVINSGSVFELGNTTLENIKRTCFEKNISTLHFESHYIYHNKISELRDFFNGITLKMKIGLETFDYNLRENFLQKGINETDPYIISKDFDEANFLFGISGQTAMGMIEDIEQGLKCFERICINIMCPNTTSVIPDKNVISEFMTKVYPIYCNNDRIDILINNTDFGVGD